MCAPESLWTWCVVHAINCRHCKGNGILFVLYNCIDVVCGVVGQYCITDVSVILSTPLLPTRAGWIADSLQQHHKLDPQKWSYSGLNSSNNKHVACRKKFEKCDIYIGSIYIYLLKVNLLVISKLLFFLKINPYMSYHDIVDRKPIYSHLFF